MIGFDNLLSVYTDNIKNKNDAIKLGIINRKSNLCIDIMILITYKLKDIYNLKSIENEIKQNIEELYNFINPIKL